MEKRIISFAIVYILFQCICIHAQQKEIPERNLTQHSRDDKYASYSPNGDYIIFESNRENNWEIFIMDAKGTAPERLTSHDSSDRRPSWHPNGKRVIFESNRDGKYELYELTLKNKKVKKIEIEMPGEPMFARYAPNGKNFAYTHKVSDSRLDIIIANRKGKIRDTLVDFGFRSVYPVWSPEGNRILFFSRHETENKDDELYLINLDGTNLERLTYWPKHNFCPTWSPDGTKIAYAVSIEGSRPEIFVMELNNRHETRITFNEDGDTLPAWSPDGKKLLITGYRKGNYEICELEW